MWLCLALGAWLPGAAALSAGQGDPSAWKYALVLAVGGLACGALAAAVWLTRER